MTRSLNFLCLALALCSGGIASAGNVTIHVTGYAEKPGRHEVPAATTLEELSKSFGGAVWGHPKRITVIRLKRPSNHTTGDRGQPETKVLSLDEITNEKKQLLLEAEDIVFVSMKRVIGAR